MGEALLFKLADLLLINMYMLQTAGVCLLGTFYGSGATRCLGPLMSSSLPPGNTISTPAAALFTYSWLCACGLSCFWLSDGTPEEKKHISFDAFSLFLYVEWLRRSSGVRECVCLFVSVCVYVCGCVCDVMNPPCPSGWAALWSACRLLCQRWCPAGTRGWRGAPKLASRPPWFTCSRRNLATGAGGKQEKRQKGRRENTKEAECKSKCEVLHWKAVSNKLGAALWKSEHNKPFDFAPEKKYWCI